MKQNKSFVKNGFITMQSLMAVILCIVMSISFVGCSDDDEPDYPEKPENALIGRWLCRIVEDDDHTFCCQLTFKKDGSYIHKDWYEGKEDDADIFTGGWWTDEEGETLYMTEDGYSGYESVNFIIIGNKLILDPESDEADVYTRR